MSDPKNRNAVGSPEAEPAVTLQEITDPTTVHEGIEFLDQDVVQLDMQRLHVRRVIVRLDGSNVVYHSSNRRSRTRTKFPGNFLIFATFGPRSKATINGVAIGSETLIVAEPSTDVEVVVEAGYESIVFLVPPEPLVGQLEALGRGDGFRMPSGAEVRQPSPPGTRPMFELGKRLIETATLQPSRFNDSKRARRAAHIEVVESVVASLGPTDGPPLRQRDRTRQEYSRVVRAATDDTLANADHRPFVADLCRAAGVSERTLQVAFQEIMGMTPVAYLSRLRLHRAREELRTTNDPSTTVSAVAVEWGFWNFGDFSIAYKRCFGESPSVTLKRRLDDIAE